MTRRLTSNSHSDIGYLSVAYESQSPLTWTPAKNDFWRTPSRRRLCSPRLQLIAKIFLSCVFLLLLWKGWKERKSLFDIEPPIEEVKTEEDRNMEAAKRDTWLWKNYPLHDGIIRGARDLRRICMPGEEKCKDNMPRMIRYRGDKNMQELASQIVPCLSPRGVLLNESNEDAVWAYPGKAKGSVEPVFGSYSASGLDGTVSFDRLGRFQAYGLADFETLDDDDLTVSSDLNWDEIKWGDLQDACFNKNHLRYKPVKERPGNSIQYSNIRHKHGKTKGDTDPIPPSSDTVKKDKRTAILIRVWTGATWTADAVVNIRAMITEASLSSGGKYQVFILLHVKDEGIPLFVAENEPFNTIKKNVPPEFHSIVEVWNHAQLRSVFSNIAEHAFVGRSPWMIVQWFARNHPEFDFFYQWEFDVRYTGHYLDLFEAVSSFGKRQPRKGIWERAGRVYIPSIHGDFDHEYRDHVRNQDPHHVWGPVPVEGVTPRGSKPPRKIVDDDYEWGVGEDADWIGFLPSFNVTNTKWWFKDYLWGYPQGTSTPRRATLIAQGRVSRRVVEIMTHENAENGHHFDAEMFPQTMCLHHGLKSTTFPHPIFADRSWPADSLQKVFNPGPFGQAGGVEESTFSKWNEYAWTNMTWYFNSALAKPTYQRFLGITAGERGGSEWEEEHGRAVIRPMLLHPVKGAKAKTWTPTGWVEGRGGK